MKSLGSSSDYVEESKFPRRRLNQKRVSVPELVDEGEENLDDFVEPRANSNDKIGKKRQRKENHESGLEKETKKKKQDSVRDDDLAKTREINEMFDSLMNNSKDGGDLVANRPKKDDDDDDDDDELIIMLSGRRSKKSKLEKKAEEIAMQVEQVMAILEIAVEDDLVLNREGKPAVNKLMKLPLLNGALSKKHLQSEFLDHGLFNLLKNWLEPLPDGSLPNINIRTAILTILNELCNLIDKQECRKEQLVKSGLGKVIMFLSKSDEETTSNKRLASDLVNRWGHIIYNKSTRYEEMFTEEEREEQHRVFLARQNKAKALKVSQTTKARDFDVDVDFSKKTKPKLAASRRVVERAKVPTTISMDFVFRPESKFDRQLEARNQMQNVKRSREGIINRLKKRMALNKRSSMRAITVSADGRSMVKYL